MCLCMCPAPTPFAILFLSLASSAAFNKSLVCSFFHLASFGFSLFSSVLWNCCCCCSVNGLTSCNIFWISHPVYRWWIWIFFYYFLYLCKPSVSSFVLISSETWLLIWAPAQKRLRQCHELIWYSAPATRRVQWFWTLPHPMLSFDLFSVRRFSLFRGQ